MATDRFEVALDLIDENILINRNEVLAYIKANSKEVVDQLLGQGRAKIPTSAGVMVIERSAIPA